MCLLHIIIRTYVLETMEESMGRKRRNGEGTWGTKTVNGHKYKFFRDANGKYTYGKTEKQVKEKLEKKKENEKKNTVKDTTIFKDYLRWYIDNIMAPKVGEQTLLTYNRSYDEIVNFPTNNICDMQLCSFTTKTPYVQNFLNALATQYARNTILNMWTVMGSALHYGIRHEKLPPLLLEDIHIPNEAQVAVKKKDVPFLDATWIPKIYNEIKSTYKNGNPKYKTEAYAIIMFINTGMRLGELKAARWNDIKNVNDRKSIRVDESIADIKYKHQPRKRLVKSPKNETSVREIPLNNIACEVLDYFDKLNPEHKPQDFIFLNSKKNPIRQQTLHRTLKRILTNIGYPNIEGVSIHSLRHTFGSLLYKKGVDLKTISVLLGHKSIRTTEEIYVGITKEQKQNAVDVLDSLI